LGATAKLAVAATVLGYGGDEDLAIAALLHDGALDAGLGLHDVNVAAEQERGV
jgi:(p)ppGpp synthase/HD superfamily hydrolase